MASRPGTRLPDPAPARPPAAIRFAKKAGESSGLRRLVAALALLAFGLLLPAQWLDPLGGLAKNLVVLPALVALWALSDRR
jgi:hypothetical protein